MKHLKLLAISFVALMMVSMTGMAHWSHPVTTQKHTSTTTQKHTSPARTSSRITKHAGKMTVDHCKAHAKTAMKKAAAPFKVRSTDKYRVHGDRGSYRITISCKNPNKPSFYVTGVSKKWCGQYAEQVKRRFPIHR